MYIISFNKIIIERRNTDRHNILIHVAHNQALQAVRKKYTLMRNRPSVHNTYEVRLVTTNEQAEINCGLEDLAYHPYRIYVFSVEKMIEEKKIFIFGFKRICKLDPSNFKQIYNLSQM